LGKYKIQALVAAIIFIHIFALLLQKEIWPFSPYPMYSKSILKSGFKTFHVILKTDFNRDIRLHHMSQIFPIGPHCIINCLFHLGKSGKIGILADQIYNNCNQDKPLCYLSDNEKIIQIIISDAMVTWLPSNQLKVEDNEIYYKKDY